MLQFRDFLCMLPAQAGVIPNMTALQRGYTNAPRAGGGDPYMGLYIFD